MNIIVFEQWDKLVALFRGLAANSAAQKSRRDISRVVAAGGRGTLVDRAANVVDLASESVSLALPDMVPGKARDFLVRVHATGECAVSFTGCDSLEGEAGALDPPADGETVVYIFTETAADVFLVERRTASKLETE